ADAVLASYIKQNMRFFVAKVNLDRMKLIGAGYLRPLQVRYDTAKFMLPLRLGTVNADGPQDLIIYALTRNGRVETTNYRTVKLPTGVDVPLYVKDEFGNFYKALFERAVKRGHARGVRRIRLGHGMVRPVCGKAHDVQGIGRIGRALDRER